MEIKISDMRLTGHDDDDELKVTKAVFDADIGPLRIRSCGIMRQPSGFLMTVLPKGAHVTRMIQFTDKDLFFRFRHAALDAYNVMSEEKDDSGLRRYLCPAIEESLAMAGVQTSPQNWGDHSWKIRRPLRT